jgi:hypothetical protein
LDIVPSGHLTLTSPAFRWTARPHGTFMATRVSHNSNAHWKTPQ